MVFKDLNWLQNRNADSGWNRRLIAYRLYTMPLLSGGQEPVERTEGPQENGNKPELFGNV